MVSKIKKFGTVFIELYPIISSLKLNYKFTQQILKKKIACTIIYNKYKIIVRPNDIDLDVLKSTFVEKYHRCPFLLPGDAVIIDLGSNVGYTLIDFKLQYPKSKLIGVELDKDNYAVLKQNVNDLENCFVLNTGIWKSDGIINYGGKDAQSFSISDNNGNQSLLSEAITMDTLLKKNNIEQVDYLKMDIEGAEEQIFLESSFETWIYKIRYISIEVHDTNKYAYKDLADKIKKVLEANDFMVLHSSVHWSSLIAINKRTL